MFFIIWPTFFLRFPHEYFNNFPTICNNKITQKFLKSSNNLRRFYPKFHFGNPKIALGNLKLSAKHHTSVAQFWILLTNESDRLTDAVEKSATFSNIFAQKWISTGKWYLPQARATKILKIISFISLSLEELRFGNHLRINKHTLNSILFHSNSSHQQTKVYYITLHTFVHMRVYSSAKWIRLEKIFREHKIHTNKITSVNRGVKILNVNLEG